MISIRKKHAVLSVSSVLVVEVLIDLFSTVKNVPNNEYKLVETESGIVRGGIRKTLLKKMEFYEFKGIPYAKSPIGKLRFKAPEPVESWKPRFLDALEHGKNCIQLANILSPEQQQSEDCLFLNIYVPADVNGNEKLPVLIHIHGGAYGQFSGDDSRYAPDFLLDKRLIVVTLNYRLNLFGFVSFGTPERSGNMGLKDQQFALKWIHSNIERFAGDKKRITLSGVSAGSASTNFHMLSNESRKYFRNAVLNSGTISNYWAYYEKSDHLEFANKTAEELGSQERMSVDDLIEFFESRPADKLRPFGSAAGFYQRLSQPTFTPILERKDAIRPSMTEVNENSSIDMDAMFSFSANEFITFYSKLYPNVYNFSDLNTNFSIPLPFRGVNLSFDSPEYQQISKEIRAFYFKNEVIDENSLMQYLALLTDINFAYGIDKRAKQHAENSNSTTYYYRFSVDSELNIFKRVFTDNGNLNGTAHSDDSCYLFYCKVVHSVYDEILQNPDDEQSKISLRVIDDLTSLVANFVKYGKPTPFGNLSSRKPLFLPIHTDRVNFLDITNDGLEPGVDPNQAANELWASIEQRVLGIN